MGSKQKSSSASSALSLGTNWGSEAALALGRKHKLWLRDGQPTGAAGSTRLRKSECDVVGLRLTGAFIGCGSSGVR